MLISEILCTRVQVVSASYLPTYLLYYVRGAGAGMRVGGGLKKEGE